MFSYINKFKLDYSKINIQTNAPVYITMSTIPSRMKNTMELIRHFLKHVNGFEKFILNVPYKYNRWPDFKINISDTIKDPRFILNRTDDQGPLTKIVGSLPIIPEDSITIICDDMCYKLNAFKDIAERADKERHKSFSFYVYPYNGNGDSENKFGNTSVMVPQGADLICTYTRNFSHLINWFNNFKQTLNITNYFTNECFFVDDQLLGWYFQTHNIPLEQVERRHRNIYIRGCDNADKRDNLNRQTGDKSRENTMSKCYSHLNNYYPI